MQSYTTIIISLLVFWLGFEAFAQNPKREMRGVWVATVKNLDWPSKTGLTTEQQKKEIDAIIDHVKELGMNAVFLQVRPAADAFFASSVEPWSKYLTGTEGKAPRPFYDPLKYWIEKAGEKGIDVHAWINPFRVTARAGEELSARHLLAKHPDWIVEYNGKLCLDPGIPDVRKYIRDIVRDIVEKYDVAGIHMDDYFYPYPVNGVDFPDTMSYRLFCDTTRYPDKNAWRRDNVNRIVGSLHKTVKSVKPWVSFGISPFGVWRNSDKDPAGSDTRAGITNYDMLHADVLTWLENGWVDYIVPQIYWYMEHPAAGFRILSEWWNENSNGIPVYAGMSIYKINSGKEAWANPGEIPDQIRAVRGLDSFEGQVFFRYGFLKQDLLGLQDSLRYKFYSTIALTPVVKGNVDIRPIGIKRVKASRKKLKWKVDKADEKNIKYFVVYSYPADEMFDPDNPKWIHTVTKAKHLVLRNFTEDGVKRYYRVSAVDKFGNEGGISKAVD